MKIALNDVGRTLYAQPELDGVEPGELKEVDTRVIIVCDQDNKLGYISLFTYTKDGETFISKVDDANILYEKQEDAIRAAIESDRSYAETLLIRCNAFEEEMRDGYRIKDSLLKHASANGVIHPADARPTPTICRRLR